MARTARVNNEEDEVMVGTETSAEESTVEQPTDKKDVTEATVSTGKKNVRIRVTEDIDCLIACRPYKFAKDKEVSVPSDVAAILCYANKAYRL